MRPISGTPAEGRTSLFWSEGGKVRNRRTLPVPARSGGGRLIERTPAVQPKQQERVKMPHTRHCRAHEIRVCWWRVAFTTIGSPYTNRRS